MSQTEELRLCYISKPWAWFTSKPLEEQWGDDWNDAPYQHNAGRPYTGEDVQQEKLAFDGPLYVPGEPPRTEYDGIGDRHHHGVAVEDMNRGENRVPWLVETDFGEMYGQAGVTISAGVSIPEFIELVEEAGGSVYRLEETEGDR